MVHGTGDDNVHMENTMQFIQQLIDAQHSLRPAALSPQDALHCGPEARHAFVSPASWRNSRRIWVNRRQ